MVVSSEMPVDHGFLTVLGKMEKGRKRGSDLGSIAEKRGKGKACIEALRRMKGYCGS